MSALLLSCLCLVTSAGLESNDTSIFEQFVRLIESRDNDLRMPPAAIGDTTDVQLSVYINELGELDEAESHFRANVFFRQSWTDKRLSYDGHLVVEDSITLPPVIFNNIWAPDVYVVNGQMEHFHDIPAPNQMFRVFPSGYIIFSQRLTLTLWCHVDLLFFPLDKQTCDMRFMSYGFQARELRLRWMEGTSVQNVNNLRLARFTTTNVTLGDCTQDFSIGNTTSAYSCVSAEFTFQRRFLYYLIQTYIPSALIVFLSWVSFWLDPLAVPGRISLGVMTILTMSTQMASAASSSLPKVSYIKAMDVWMTTCMCFLFMALVEFALVNSLARRRIHRRGSPHEDDSRFRMAIHAVMDKYMDRGRQDAPPQATSDSAPKKQFHLKGAHVDQFSRVAFPLLFILFNVAYWLYYS